MPRSLFARSLLILTLPIVLTLVISTYVFFERHWERMAGRLATGVAGEIAFLTQQIDDGFKHAPYGPVTFEKIRSDSFANLQINFSYKIDGEIQPDPVEYFGRGEVIKKLLYAELKERVDKPYRILVDVEEKWVQVQVQLAHGAVIYTIPERRLFSSSGYVFLIWMMGVSTFLLVVAILFMRNQIRPIKRLAIAAERFGIGRDVPFFKPEGAREVRRAAKAFIGMRERIDRQLQQRTAMLAGVSHDLRTPLTRMKLQAEMMGDNDDVKALKSDISDMERMIEGYIQFIRGEGDEEVTRTDLLPLIQRVTDNFKREGLDITLESKGKSFDIFLRPLAFERCLNNLLSNAKKYASHVEVSLKNIEDHIVIIIDDNGCGIDETLYEDVFKPFFREETSRNSKTGGTGLGLPITKDIILAHGGNIELYKSPLGGLRVRIELPL